MALIACGECGKQISDKAVTCPHCGAPVAIKTEPLPLQDQPTPSKPKLWLWIPLGLVAVFLGFGFVVGNTPEGKERARQREAINLCWGEQGRKSNNAGQSQFIAGACERMEADYTRRWGTRP